MVKPHTATDLSSKYQLSRCYTGRKIAHRRTDFIRFFFKYALTIIIFYYFRFECDVCHRSFACKSNRNKHKLIHNSPKHICMECGKKIIQKQITLNRSMKIKPVLFVLYAPHHLRFGSTSFVMSQPCTLMNIRQVTKQNNVHIAKASRNKNMYKKYIF
jgi:hypothetical protein